MWLRNSKKHNNQKLINKRQNNQNKIKVRRKSYIILKTGQSETERYRLTINVVSCSKVRGHTRTNKSK